MRTRDSSILEHIFDYCRHIEGSITRYGAEYCIFLSDYDYRSSVSMSLLQIGELSFRLSDNYKKSTMNRMNWRIIKGMRNLFAHDYVAMDIETIWNTAINDIPALSEFCQKEIERLKENQDDPER